MVKIKTKAWSNNKFSNYHPSIILPIVCHLYFIEKETALWLFILSYQGTKQVKARAETWTISFHCIVLFPFLIFKLWKCHKIIFCFILIWLGFTFLFHLYFMDPDPESWQFTLYLLPNLIQAHLPTSTLIHSSILLSTAS